MPATKKTSKKSKNANLKKATKYTSNDKSACSYKGKEIAKEAREQESKIQDSKLTRKQESKHANKEGRRHAIRLKECLHPRKRENMTKS